LAQRLFAAIDLDDAVRTQLASALSPQIERGAAAIAGQRAGAGVRWLPTANWHLTLQFFGRVQDEAAAGVQAACRKAARARAPFAVELHGAGAFPSPRRARVLWIGLSRGHEHVAALAEALGAHTELLGFARERREFRSHVTVARLKTPHDVQPLVGSLRIPSLPMQVSELTLFRSHVSSKGAEYETLARFALGDP
jgi:2'-5' RNA ligase